MFGQEQLKAAALAAAAAATHRSRRRGAPRRRTPRAAAAACRRGRPWGPPACRCRRAQRGTSARTSGGRSRAACCTLGRTGTPPAGCTAAAPPARRSGSARWTPGRRAGTRRRGRPRGTRGRTAAGHRCRQKSRCDGRVRQQLLRGRTGSKANSLPPPLCAALVTHHTPPQENSSWPQRLSVTTAPQKQVAGTTRGQGGQGPAKGRRRGSAGELSMGLRLA